MILERKFIFDRVVTSEISFLFKDTYRDSFLQLKGKTQNTFYMLIG